MPDGLPVPESEAQESVWTQIILHMESLYAQLADSQAEIEQRAEELGQAKELADNVIRSINDALITLDSSGTIALVNEAAERLFGFAGHELVGRALDSLLPEQAQPEWRWQNLLRQIRQHERLGEVETTWLDRHGATIPAGLSVSGLRDRWGQLVGAVVVARDLRETKRRIAQARARARELQKANAELRQLQAELIQAAKMSSLGRLAAGVAHELNNPIGGIVLYTDLLLEDMPADDPRRANVQKIAEQAARCRRIVRGLLDFARPTESVAVPVDVHALLWETMGILYEQQILHNVEVRWDLEDEVPTLRGDPDHLRQAFLNILLNAVEAMDGKGVLTITTSPAPDGKRLVVSISDTGCGIPEEDVEHLFEPFFTTKDDGTGLGLPITYGIVERHEGAIRVTSEVGKGTTFIITLGPMREAGGNAK